MSDRYAGFKGGDYSRARDAARGAKRAMERSGVIEIVQANEVIKPEPNKEWHYRAKEIWTLGSMDEASAFWSAGDWLRLKMACDIYDDMLTGKTRYSAQAMEIVFGALTELRLSDRAKRADNIVVQRGDEADEHTEWLADAIEQVTSDLLAESD